jgi:uncharacterized membrane protein
VRRGWRQRAALIRPLSKVLLSIVAAAATGAALVPLQLPGELALVVTWDAFALVSLLLTWISILTLEPAQICELAQVEDPGRGASLVLVLVGAGAAFLAVLVLLNASMGMQGGDRLQAIGVALSAVALAWLLIHTVFTLRYAHLYYDGAAGEKPIAFPGAEMMPDYLDFAYFAFVIGMTAQTADISIRGRDVRRFALLHGLIAFGYNTAIVAMSIGLLTTLLSSR